MTTTTTTANSIQGNEEAVKVTKQESNDYIWKQTFKDSEGKVITQHINMNDMSAEHLQKAFYRTQVKINEYIMLSDSWEKLCIKIEEIAANKGIELKDADDRKMKAYHAARRKTVKVK